MPERITFANVEEQVATYLNAALADRTPPLKAYVALPDPLPEEAFVRAVLTGSRRRNLEQMDRQVTFEAWSQALNAEHQWHVTSELGLELYGLVSAFSLPDGTCVPEGEDGWVGGPYPEPDPVSGRPRYVMTATIRQPAIVAN